MDVREQYAVDGYVRISPDPGVLLEQCTRLDNQLDELLQNRKIKTKSIEIRDQPIPLPVYLRSHLCHILVPIERHPQKIFAFVFGIW